MMEPFTLRNFSISVLFFRALFLNFNELQFQPSLFLGVLVYQDLQVKSQFSKSCRRNDIVWPIFNFPFSYLRALWK